ncbi:MAG: branched-chain amino acid ABC transporter permease [Gemmatimonadetes bacterium]|nr:branched-chain amino acid ABC transporter permease [Gemmatimonadota bacterium]
MREAHVYLGVAILVALVPLVGPDPYTVHVLTLCLLYAALSSSWNLVSGYAGLFSFGHQAFFGLGAYVSALLAMKAGVAPWLGLVIGGGAAGAAGLLIALPCLGLRAPPYVAIATLGFAEICRFITMNLVGLTRGELGLGGIPEMPAVHLPLFGTLSFGARGLPYFYLILVIYVGVMAVLYRLVRSPLGLALKAVRDSQDAAESLGVNVKRTKLIVFGLSSVIAGVTGAFYAHYVLILTPSSVFSVPIMVEIVAMTLIGGLGTFVGPSVGAFAVTLLLEYLRVLGDYRLLIYGTLLIVLILLMPAGVVRRILGQRVS